MSEKDFVTAVQSLREAIPNMNGFQIIAGFAKLTGMVQDGHNNLDLSFGTGLQLNYPLRVWPDSDGIYVASAPPQAASLVGGKLTSIDGVPADSIWDAMLDIAPHDPGNLGYARVTLARQLFLSAYLLYGLGFARSPDSARFEVENNGGRVAVTVTPEWIPVRLLFRSAPRDWPDARVTTSPPPLWLQHPDTMFWFQYLPAQRFIYVQINGVGNAPNQTMADFSREIADCVNHNRVDRLALDLRRNGGGNNYLLRPLIVSLIQMQRINQRGRFFVLIGPETFSAAQNLVNRLENYTEATFAGQPTGENVNFYGDTRRFTLPNCRLPVAMANLYWQDKDPRDKRKATYPEIAVDNTFRDYVNNRDPALELVLQRAGSFPTIEESILSGLQRSGLEGAVEAYKNFTADPVHRYFSDAENRINALGYSLIEQGRLPDAIAVFKVNTKAYPLSFNTWDSLGEAYADAAQYDEAIAAYKESLRLNPASPTGSAALAKLQKRGH